MIGYKYSCDLDHPTKVLYFSIAMLKFDKSNYAMLKKYSG